MEALKLSDQEIRDQRDYKIVKSNDLIQKSRFQLTTQEQKIILYIISKIKPEDSSFEVRDISINEFCRVCGIVHGGKNYANIKATIKSLSDKSVWMKTENGSETVVRWFNKVWINRYSGLIRIRLYDDLKPYLLQLKERFTTYELLYTLAMRSQYSIRLYELLKSYEFRRTKLFEIEELKRILCCENYNRYADFKRKVLDISMKEISELSDLSVSYTIMKEGRKYTQIEFKIIAKKNISDRMKTWAKIDEILNPTQLSLFENDA